MNNLPSFHGNSVTLLLILQVVFTFSITLFPIKPSGDAPNILQTSFSIPRRSFLFAFCSGVMPHWTATGNLINHSAIIQHRHRWNCAACHSEHPVEMTCRGVCRKASLLLGQLWVFQSQLCCCSHLFLQFIRNIYFMPSCLRDFGRMETVVGWWICDDNP